MWTNLLLALYCVLIVLASVAGGALPLRLRLTHTRMQLMMSFVAGLMLGVALLHMLPHAAAELPSLDWAVEAALVGLLLMFFMIRIFHFHQHVETDGDVDAHAGEDQYEPVAPHEHGPACDHGHDHAHVHNHAHGHAHSPAGVGAPRHAFSWVGLAVGLSIHTLIDGMALAAGVATGAFEQPGWGLFGLGTFLAVVLHKPLDAMSITMLMAAAGWSHARQRLVNYAFAMMCPLGAVGFWFCTEYYITMQHEVLGLSLAFSAGVFLCISLGDLLPEVHFHSHDRGKLSAALVAGVGLAFLVGFIEPEHGRSHVPVPAAAPLQSGSAKPHNTPVIPSEPPASERAGS